MNLFFTFIQISLSHLYAADVYIPPAFTLQESKWQLSINNEYFQTKSVWDVDGQEQEIFEESSYEQFQSDLNGSYGLTDELQLSFGVRARYNAAMIDTGPIVSDVTQMGVESVSAHFLYNIAKVSKVYLSLEASARHALYTNPAYNAGDPNRFIVLGDAENEHYVGGILNYYEPTYKNSLALKLGYRNPGDSLASEMVYDLEGAMDFRYLALVFNINGVMSMNNDPQGLTKPDIDNSPSNLYNSINRSWLRAGGGFNIRLGSHWRVDFRAEQTLQGKSTDNGLLTMANLVYRQGEENLDDKKIEESFKEYSVEGEIIKVSPNKLFLVVNKGIVDGVIKGMQFDIFDRDDNNGNTLICRGVAYEVKPKLTIIKVVKVFFKDAKLKEGMTGRGGLISH